MTSLTGEKRCELLPRCICCELRPTIGLQAVLALGFRSKLARVWGATLEKCRCLQAKEGQSHVSKCLPLIHGQMHSPSHQTSKYEVYALARTWSDPPKPWHDMAGARDVGGNMLAAAAAGCIQPAARRKLSGCVICIWVCYLRAPLRWGEVTP